MKKTAGNFSWLMLSAATGTLVMLFVAVGAKPATAQSTNAEYQCTSDVMRLCSEFIPSRSPIIACLLKKRQQLSPDCRSVMTPKGKKSKRYVRRDW